MMHIFSMKGKTKTNKIQVFPASKVLYLPLLQHIGQPAEPVVKVGQKVLKYELLAKAVGSVSANIHSPVSGVVSDITKYPLANGHLVDTIVIENDFREEEESRLSTDYKLMNAEDILGRIKDAGIVGEGGAQYPTHIKYKIKEHKIDTFIINGTECEPYLTADYALMNEYTEELLKGIVIVNKVLNANRMVITLEKQNSELLNVFSAYLKKEEFKNIEIQLLPDEYPQGGELQVIKLVTGKELARGVLPRNVGVIVSNVGTVYAIYKAVAENKPLIERIITISGEKAINPGNYTIKTGTPVKHILETVNGERSLKDDVVVLGGPMMGVNINDSLVPVTKGSSGVLFLERQLVKRENCILCGYCADVCPMRLMPFKFASLYEAGEIRKLGKYNLLSCIECAACEYACPSNVALIDSIKKGKVEFNKFLIDAK